MNYTPHPYQDKAIRWLLGRPSAALWLDMGLGKTVATLTALRMLLVTGEANRVLIVAPLRVAMHTWPDEIRKWNHTRDLSYQVIRGEPASREAQLAGDKPIHIINYENLVWLIKHYAEKGYWPYDTIVFDEASKMKAPGTKRFRAVRKVRPHVDRVIELTGTPAANGLLDLWAQAFLLDKGKRLGSTYTRYRDMNFDPDRLGYRWFPKSHTESWVHEQLADICLSMSAEDYLTLPDRIDNKIMVQMPPQAVEGYARLEREMFLQLQSGEIEAFNSAALTNKCLQYANGAVYTDAEAETWEEVHRAKLQALDEVIEEAAGASVLVAYNFRSDLERLKKHLLTKPWEFDVLGKDPKTIEWWNDGRIQVLLAHPASAGHGLNLQAGGNIICWFGMNWSLELYQQFNARLHRQGQERPVFVHHLLCQGTVDQDVMVRLESKREVQDVLLEAVKLRGAA